MRGNSDDNGGVGFNVVMGDSRNYVRYCDECIGIVLAATAVSTAVVALRERGHEKVTDRS